MTFIVTSTTFSPELFRQHREQSNLSRYALAKELGRCPDTIRDYERGAAAPSARVLGRAADVLGCEVSDLFARGHDGAVA